eukprot:5126902-Alexandrium_andersonii.AAC.1
MANRDHPGGGLKAGHGPQEEDLRRRSDLFRFLEQQNWEKAFYPIEDRSCLLSRDVTVFRGEECEGYPFLSEPFRIDVISCSPAPGPYLDDVTRRYQDDFQRQRMRAKVFSIVKAAVTSGCSIAVFPAFGC